MSVNITHRHMEGGTEHQHIARVKWQNRENGTTGENSRAEMVDWIDSKSGVAYVTSLTATVRVGVVHATPPYLRTVADGQWTDNLLALPTY